MTDFTVAPSATKKKDVAIKCRAHDWRSVSHRWHQLASQNRGDVGWM